MTGTAEALYRTTIGGWMPGGMTARMELVDATICEIARSMDTSGWKYTFSMVTPCSV